MLNFLNKKTPSKWTSLKEVSDLNINKSPKDIFILGNGISLNNHTPESLNDQFLIGTNRTWLWGNTDILIWRDSRITEELDFFEIEKGNSLWIAGEPSLSTSKVNLSENIISNIDYRFTDSWKDNFIGSGIKWNGIIFHALALAKHISPKATIHLIGVDLGVQSDMHHFFNIHKGFNMGVYKSGWQEENFHYKKRLDMMVKNFEKLKQRDFKIINHSENSKLTEIFGYDPI